MIWSKKCGFAQTWIRLLTISETKTENRVWRYAETRAGLTIVPVVIREGTPPAGAPDQLQNFSHAFLTLNVTVNFLGKEKCNI